MILLLIVRPWTIATGKTGTPLSGLGYDSLLIGFLGVKTKPEADGAKWSLLIFPFMDMQ